MSDLFEICLRKRDFITACKLVDNHIIDVNAEFMNKTPLEHACVVCEPDIRLIRSLVNNGADPQLGVVPLEISSYGKCGPSHENKVYECLEFLFNNGAKANKPHLNLSPKIFKLVERKWLEQNPQNSQNPQKQPKQEPKQNTDEFLDSILTQFLSSLQQPMPKTEKKNEAPKVPEPSAPKTEPKTDVKTDPLEDAMNQLLYSFMGQIPTKKPEPEPVTKTEKVPQQNPEQNMNQCLDQICGFANMFGIKVDSNSVKQMVDSFSNEVGQMFEPKPEQKKPEPNCEVHIEIREIVDDLKDRDDIRVMLINKDDKLEDLITELMAIHKELNSKK